MRSAAQPRLSVVRGGYVASVVKSDFGRWLLVAEEKSPRTVRNYESRVRHVEEWLKENGRQRLRRCAPEDIAEFGEHLRWSYATRDGYRSAIAAYWRYVKRTDAPTKAIRRPKKPRMVCRALETGGIDKLLRTASEMGRETYAAVCLFYYPALRVSEAATLRWEDVHDELAEPELWVIGKGSKPETIEIDERVIDALAPLPRLCEWVFPSPKIAGHHIHPNTLERWVTQAGYAALGLHVTPHILRHTCGADMIDNGGELRIVQDHMRHSSPEMTAGYTRAKKQNKRALLRLLS